jgi:hypothetical protein
MEWSSTMNEQTLAILVFGSAVVAFAFFASYMAARQKASDEREANAARDIDC